jgi:hypothetical protein
MRDTGMNESEGHRDDPSAPLEEEVRRPQAEYQVNEQIMAKIEARRARKRSWFYKLLCWLVEPETGWPGRRR